MPLGKQSYSLGDNLSEWLLYRKARDVAFSMAVPVILARRQAQVRMAVNMVQEGCRAMADAVVEKEHKSLRGKKKTNQTPAAAYNTEEWMQGIEEDDSEVELRNGRVGNCRAEPRNAWSWNVSRGRRCCRRQGRPQFPWNALGGSPFSGGGSSDQGSDQVFHQLNLTRGSREGKRPVWEERGLRVKVNLPIFKDEKTKDTVTYGS